jgi:hypothetical protein
MKTRNGFVSNSSSSSFVVRGIKITDEEAENAYAEGEDGYSWARKFGVQQESTRYYFGGDETNESIVGLSLGGLEDGDVTELSEPDDKDITAKLLAAGIEVGDRPIKTYVQFISNDNY